MRMLLERPRIGVMLSSRPRIDEARPRRCNWLLTTSTEALREAARLRGAATVGVGVGAAVAPAALSVLLVPTFPFSSLFYADMKLPMPASAADAAGAAIASPRPPLRSRSRQ